METMNRADTIAPTDSLCAECMGPVTDVISDIKERTLCRACAAAYYAACAACHGLVARDEAMMRDEATFCAACFQQAERPPDVEVPDDAEVESLVAEYVALNSQSKELKKRLDEIKERLKIAASIKPRVAGAVTLRAGDEAIRCSYRSSLKCDAEKVAALEQLLEPERFASMFKRKVSFDAIKENIQEFLISTESAELREAIRDAVEETEVPYMSVVAKKR